MSESGDTIFELKQFGVESPLGNWIKKKTEEIKVETRQQNAYQPKQIPQQPPRQTSANNYLFQATQEHHECYDQFGDAKSLIYIVLRHSTMIPFNTDNYVWITNRAQANDDPETTDFSINAQFLYDYFQNNDNEGISYAFGDRLGGGLSQPGWYYIAQDRDGNYSFGLGDPPEDSWCAVGGARPLIINGLQYGEENLYAPGCTSAMPLKGDVPEESLPFLIQKSANYFDEQNKRHEGKTIVGHNSSTNELILVVQEDGVDGYLLDTIRNNLAIEGYDNVLAFDGSSSSMLVKDDEILIDPGDFKDWTLNSGITFSVPC